MKLPLLALDTANHVIYGFVIASVASLILTFFGSPYVRELSIAAAAAFALIKEAVDYFARSAGQPHTPDTKDVAATIIGALGTLL